MAKSGGQWIGTIVGGIIGAFVGYPMLGASLGGMVGGLIDPPKGPKIEGPRINDLNVQTATYGAQIPVIKGTVATFGNIFWVENNQIKETKKTESQGGKGGGGQETTTYSYSATFALGVCLGPVDGIRRIWCSGKLIFDAGSNNLSAIMASNISGIVQGMLTSIAKHANPTGAGGGGITFYNGSADQQPDPRMQAALGVANTPAYRGLAYLVFEDFQLADFGNTLMGAQFKIEVVDTASIDQYAIRTRVPSGLFPNFDTEYGDYGFSTSGPYNPSIENGVFRFDKERTRYNVNLEGVLLSRGTASGVAPGSVGDTGERFYVGTTSGGHAVYYNNTGPQASGYLVVGGNATFSGKFASTYELQGACVGADGNLYVQTYDGSGSVLTKYDGLDLSVIWTHNCNLYYDLGTLGYPFIPGTSASMAVNEGSLLWWMSIAGQEVTFAVYDIGYDGTLTIRHEFTSEGGSGWDGHTICAAASGMMCAITHNHGGFYVFDATPVVVNEMVPLSEIVESLCLQSNLLTSSDLNVTALTQDVRGYRISATAAIRAALEPLQACWPFDAIQDGYKIKFIPRGGSSVATVSSDDLGAAAPGDKEVIRLSVAREMDTQLPRRIESTFIDYNREYDTGAGPGAERLNTDAVNIRQIELPVVLTVDEAAGIEQTLLYLAWTERQDISFTLPPTYCALQPGDVITVNSTDSSYLVRLTRIQYLPDGRLECAAKYNHAPIYTPSAVGQEGAVTGQTLAFAGPTMLALLDVPCMATVQNQPGLLAATTGVYGGWPGATLLRSDDSGQSWQSLQGFGTPGAAIGYCTGSIGAGPTHIVDTASRLNVRLLSGSLASVTELQMFAGNNHFAYGLDGRWEIVAAMTVTAESDGTFTLQNMMRGRFGTEQHMTAHANSDMLVLLDTTQLRFIGLDVGALNITRQWRAVTRGAILDSAPDVSFAYSGVNLECLSPIDATASMLLSSNDWTITWVRRSRLPVEAFSGVATPIGESSESYEVDIHADDTMTTVVRTITGLSSPSATYTNAQQVADFGSTQFEINFSIYQVSSMLGRGYRSSYSITYPSASADIYIGYRVFGMHFDGTNNSTTFTEWSGKTFTASGNAKLTTTGMKYGTACGTFDGTGDYISMAAYHADFNPESGSYGFGGWIYTTSLAQALQTIASTTGGNVGWIFYITSSGELAFDFYYGTGGSQSTGLRSAAGVITVNTWIYVWWSRAGADTYRLFAGSGTTCSKVAELVVSGTIYNPAAFRMGRWDALGTNTRDFTGRFDDFTAYKGLPIYTASFQTPTAAFLDA